MCISFSRRKSEKYEALNADVVRGAFASSIAVLQSAYGGGDDEWKYILSPRTFWEHLPTEKQNGCGMKHVGFYGAREKVDGYEI